MPLARIITDSVDESLELTMQLRSRGFQVETVAPGDVPSTPADLEVRLEECNSEDVLMRTAQVSEADDLWVFVAPGALDESVRPVRAILPVASVIRIPEAKSSQSRPQVAPAVVPFAVPEDDPILLELLEFNRQANAIVETEVRPTNGNGTHGAILESDVASPAAAVTLPAAVPKNGTVNRRTWEIPEPSAEVVVFPATPESSVRTRSLGEDVALAGSREVSEPAPTSSADLRFWRIASVAAALAIAALLLGVHVSRTPELAINTPQATSTVDAKLLQPHQSATDVSTRSKPAVPAPAKPPAAKTNKARVSRPPIEFASKTVRLHKRQSRRLAKPLSDDVIAKDTVVYFDRKGRPSVQKPTSDKRHSDLY
jgi:hypothetical protein